MRRDTKIVFIHRQWGSHLPFVLNQAKTVASKSGQVVLIESQVEGIPEDVEIVPFEKLDSSRARAFESSYVHRSVNPHEFELFCWLRWFYLLEYMKSNKVDSVLYLDSDVMLYTSPEEILRSYGDLIGDCAFVLPACASSSFWTIESLTSFCDFCIESFSPSSKYAEVYDMMWKSICDNKLWSGINDMTSLLLYWEERKDKVFNLAAEVDGGTFDRNISCPDQAPGFDCVMNVRTGVKHVEFIDGLPYFVRSSDGRKVLAHCIHFQGRSKSLIWRHYTGRPFKGKSSLVARHLAAIYCPDSVKKCVKALAGKLWKTGV